MASVVAIVHNSNTMLDELVASVSENNYDSLNFIPRQANAWKYQWN